MKHEIEIDTKYININNKHFYHNDIVSVHVEKNKPSIYRIEAAMLPITLFLTVVLLHFFFGIRPVSYKFMIKYVNPNFSQHIANDDTGDFLTEYIYNDRYTSIILLVFIIGFVIDPISFYLVILYFKSLRFYKLFIVKKGSIPIQIFRSKNKNMIYKFRNIIYNKLIINK